jgi:Fungal specific transcription factor domain
MSTLNQFVNQFDPILHTFEFVRTRSAFLLTSILAVSAKTARAELFKKLRRLAEDHLTQSFSLGSKSTEIVQAILLLTYWKDVNDNRAWLLVGHACRMSIEMNWHKFKSIHQPKVSQGPEDQYATRMRRNIERTWLVMFVYDRRSVYILTSPRLQDLI